MASFTWLRTNNNEFALKLIAPVPDPSVRLSFEQEVQSTLGLAGENLLAVIDYGECLVGSSRGLFTVMEYCPDGDYRDVLSTSAERQISLEEIVGHMRQVLEGLKVLHTKTIHRDLKPENVLVAGDTLKIGDFGLAKFVDEATRTLTFKGSGRHDTWRRRCGVDSMSPQQLTCMPSV